MYIYITHTYSRVQNKVSITVLLHDRSTMFTVSVPFPVFNCVFAAQQKHSENMFEKWQTLFPFSGVTGATAVPRGSHRDTLPPCPPDIVSHSDCGSRCLGDREGAYLCDS